MAEALRGGRARVDRPRFTIITSSLDQAPFLIETIHSVRDQRRDDVEHIVLDGGSTDESVEVLRAHDESLAYWESAPDDGQAAVWNAGVRRARGDIIAFLNSDDLLLPGALDEMERLAAAQSQAEWLVGGTRYFGEMAPALVYPGVPQRSAAEVLFFASYAPQPGHFFRRSVFARVGEFDETLHYAFDHEFFVRCALAAVPSAATPAIVAGFRFHGASKSVTQRERQMRETLEVEWRHWPEVLGREGRHARAVRADRKGHLALEASRDALMAGHRGRGWRLLARAVREYPSMFRTRAFLGTVQRLMGFRR